MNAVVSTPLAVDTSSHDAYKAKFSHDDERRLSRPFSKAMADTESATYTTPRAFDEDNQPGAQARRDAFSQHEKEALAVQETQRQERDVDQEAPHMSSSSNVDTQTQMNQQEPSALSHTSMQTHKDQEPEQQSGLNSLVVVDQANDSKRALAAYGAAKDTAQKVDDEVKTPRVNLSIAANVQAKQAYAAWRGKAAFLSPGAQQHNAPTPSAQEEVHDEGQQTVKDEMAVQASQQQAQAQLSEQQSAPKAIELLSEDEVTPEQTVSLKEPHALTQLAQAMPQDQKIELSQSTPSPLMTQDSPHERAGNAQARISGSENMQAIDTAEVGAQYSRLTLMQSGPQSASVDEGMASNDALENEATPDALAVSAASVKKQAVASDHGLGEAVAYGAGQSLEANNALAHVKQEGQPIHKNDGDDTIASRPAPQLKKPEAHLSAQQNVSGPQKIAAPDLHDLKSNDDSQLIIDKNAPMSQARPEAALASLLEASRQAEPYRLNASPEAFASAMNIAQAQGQDQITISAARLSREVGSAIGDGMQRIDLRVTPPGSQEISIGVSLVGAQVNLLVAGSAPDLQQHLQSGMEDMRDRLRDFGLDLGSMQFGQGDQPSQNDSQQSRDGQQLARQGQAVAALGPTLMGPPSTSSASAQRQRTLDVVL